VNDFKPDCVMHLAAILSASGEKNPQLCFDINLPGFKNILDICTENKISMFSPSTIAAFGPSTPRLGYLFLIICKN
jgi:nucleoside-diphosphate-sugar epimerase